MELNPGVEKYQFNHRLQLNLDGTINVVDIVTIVNFILSQ